MMKKDITVTMDNGPMTRPVALLVQIASQFDSEIYVEMENRRVNAKSIMGMMTLGLDNGAEVSISANGADEEAALERVEEYLTRRAS